MNQLTTHFVEDIRELDPCYDPVERGYCAEDWSGTALDVLRAEQVPADDRLWVVCNPGWIDDRTLRLFAVWCAREALKLIDNPDPRSVAACDVAERYANGQATDEELTAARDAVRDAVWDADGDAWYAARDAARDAAWTAARTAARTAAWYTARDAQVEKLIEFLENEQA